MKQASLRLFIILSAVLLLALASTGCGGGLGGGATAAFLLGLSMLFAAGCSQLHGRIDDAGPALDAGPDARAPIPDGGHDAGPELPDAGPGSWEPCCTDGVISSCFCPSGWACNYWFTDCGGGTCAFTPERCPGDAGTPDAGTHDAGTPDAGGYWEPCCDDGVISTCFCPGYHSCNYGDFTDCGDGTCADPGSDCLVPLPGS